MPEISEAAKTAAKHCYTLDIYYKDSKSMMAGEIQKAIDQALAARDTQWREAIVPGNTESLVAQMCSTPESASAFVQAMRDSHAEDVRDLNVQSAEVERLKEENEKLRAAIRRAGFAILQASNQWDICDVSEKAKATEAKTTEIIVENIELGIKLDAAEKRVEAYSKITGLVYEDELPVDITDEMFQASRVIEGVRMYPLSSVLAALTQGSETP